MKKEINMSDVFRHGEGYYTEEYKNAWRKDFDLLERMTKNCSGEEVERLYCMINEEPIELLDMVQYIGNNKN